MWVGDKSSACGFQALGREDVSLLEVSGVRLQWSWDLKIHDMYIYTMSCMSQLEVSSC